MNVDNIPYPSTADGVDLSLNELSEIEKIFFENVEKIRDFFAPRWDPLLGAAEDRLVLGKLTPRSQFRFTPHRKHNYIQLVSSGSPLDST